MRLAGNGKKRGSVARLLAAGSPTTSPAGASLKPTGC
jgi:hypothetical protein